MRNFWFQKAPSPEELPQLQWVSTSELGNIFCLFAVWPKSPEAASGKFEQVWPTVTLTKNGFSPCAAPLKPRREDQALDQRIPEPECLMLATAWALSPLPALQGSTITFTMLPSHLQVIFSSKVPGQMLGQPFTLLEINPIQCLQAPGILRAALAVADFK